MLDSQDVVVAAASFDSLFASSMSSFVVVSTDSVIPLARVPIEVVEVSVELSEEVVAVDDTFVPLARAPIEVVEVSSELLEEVVAVGEFFVPDLKNLWNFE